MKILDYGNIKPEIATCWDERCKCTFEYTSSDIHGWTNANHEYMYVVCPGCGLWYYILKDGDKITNGEPF